MDRNTKYENQGPKPKTETPETHYWVNYYNHYQNIYLPLISFCYALLLRNVIIFWNTVFNLTPPDSKTVCRAPNSTLPVLSWIFSLLVQRFLELDVLFVM